MAVTEYKNHQLEIMVVSDVPMSLFNDALGQQLVLLLTKLNEVSGVQEMKAEQIGGGPPFIIEMTVVHDGGNYNDVTTIDVDGVPRLSWPNAVNDGWDLVQFTRFMDVRNNLRTIFAAFHPTLVEIIFL
jgi:hypothetical protein